ncbi:hypothetical protein [Sphingomonas sp.]|uniref:hypothetical protein n=1 Tax=Sphingomonas sp. TaxID=28214 RepID=UPI003B3A1FE3
MAFLTRNGLLAIGVATSVASAATASGQMPPLPLEDRNLASFAACRAALEAIWHQDIAKADPKPIAANGGERQTLISTKGVIPIDATHAEYAVEEGWQFRVPVPDAHQIRTTYSYDQRRYECAGKHLRGTSTQGYALEGYAPMEDKPAP